jgi:hypothetical protein
VGLSLWPDQTIHAPLLCSATLSEASLLFILLHKGVPYKFVSFVSFFQSAVAFRESGKADYVFVLKSDGRCLRDDVRGRTIKVDSPKMYLGVVSGSDVQSLL